MVYKLRIIIFLILTVGVVFISGCLQNDDLTKVQTQDSDPLIGTWKTSGTEGIWVFNKDHTGYVDAGSDSVFPQNLNHGKTYFKYKINGSNVIVYDYMPCAKSYYPCNNPSNFEYKFIDKNTLIMGNSVLEKSWW